MGDISNHLITWAEALESDLFHQGTQHLVQLDDTDEDGYALPPQKAVVRHCCLGVACEKAVDAGVEGIRRNLDPAGRSMGFEVWDTDIVGNPMPENWVEHDDEDLPAVVQEWLGVTQANPVLFREDGTPQYAIDLNDNRGYSFKQIASKVRELAAQND